MTVQLPLFDVARMMQKYAVSVEAYYSEFQSLANHQRNNAGYGGDVRAERKVRELTAEGDRSYKQWTGNVISDDACRDALYELIICLWCVKVNGKVCRDIYQNPRPPKVYNPVIDDRLVSRIPPEVWSLIPTEKVLLACYEEYEGREQRVYKVIYYREDNGAWYSAANLYDYQKRKWMDGRTTKLYGQTFRADRDHQWWTHKGGLPRQRKITSSIPKLPPYGATT